MLLRTPQFEVVFAVLAVVWVGGWGFIMFRYPEFFARINTRFGYHTFTTPKYATLLRKLGLVEMILAGLSVLVMSAMAALGYRWF